MLWLSLILAQDEIPPDEQLPDFEAIEAIEARDIAPERIAARVEVGPQLGLLAPRSALQAGPGPGLTVAWSPETMAGRLRVGGSFGWSTASTDGVTEGAAWDAREHHVDLIAVASVRAFGRLAPVSPELSAGLGAQQFSTVVDSPGGRTLDRGLRPVWRVGPGLTAAMPVGSLSLEVLIEGTTNPALGAESALALRPQVAWRWHR